MTELRPLTLSEMRARLKNQTGRAYWRSLDELADSEAFHELVQREFPRLASAWNGGISRRQFLKLALASLGLAGLAACSPPPREQVVPYVRKPEHLLPGRPLFFATAMPLSGYGAGLLVESHEGRPTKVEGNPDHPASLGATDSFAQASVLGLYDPDRSQTVLNQGRIRTWEAFTTALAEALEPVRAGGGSGLHILTETVSSPTLADQLRRLLEKLPNARWHQWEPLARDNVRAGAQLAFGEPVESRYHFDRADVVLSLDADFLACGPASLRYARDFARRRHLYATDAASMNRLYVVESSHSSTGASADHRLPVRSVDIERVARAAAAGVGVSVAAADLPASVPAQWVAALTRDLLAHRGACLVVAGEGQPPIVHALAHAMNAALGNVGSTVVYTDPVAANPVDQLASLRELADAMAAGTVQVLVILSGNPAFNAPADIPFADLLNHVPASAHLSQYDDETSARCQWHISEAHYLEAWGDVRAFDGTVSLIQPLIAPLYGGRTAHDVLALLIGEGPVDSYNAVRAFWQSQLTGADFEAAWRRALHDGVMPDSALPERNVTLRSDWLDTPPSIADPSSLELAFRPEPSLYDGRFANNGWLQELPRPVTKLTWDNAALIGPATAERLGLRNEDVVELRFQGRAVRAPAWIVPGQAQDSVTVWLGHGRTRAGRVGTGTGFNAYALRPTGALWFGPGLEVAPTGQVYPLATMQLHHLIEGRNVLRAGTLAEYEANPEFAHEVAHETDPALETLQLYPEYKYEGYRWGMAIDLTACIGCQACVVACQAENNIPIVGKDEVRNQREMHWLRVDSYFTGEPDNPATFFQPVPCMQCETAPCEVVCPVGATAHSAEGLNDMTYNRCVGTRYCSHNCPYKVRRFNFLQYADLHTPSLKLLANPDVTVRTRGVMEKCTYCVQRIRAAQNEAEKNGRRVADGEMVTACQAVCPADAIVFGDLNDPNSRVARMKAHALNYAMLSELNTQPRTTYLAAVRNRNPEIPEPSHVEPAP
jgi:molybdopterin-containing oxidoreductase family iron-sulfur binding subunit